MSDYTQKQLDEILRKHNLWVEDEEGGEKAILSGADLTNAYMRGVDIHCVTLTGAKLGGVKGMNND